MIDDRSDDSYRWNLWSDGDMFRIVDDENDEMIQLNGTADTIKLTGDVNITGFTQLGSTGLNIKMKKLTGTTHASEGNFVTVAHGIADHRKIISVEVLVEGVGASYITHPHSHTYTAGYQFDYYFNSVNVIVLNLAGNSGQILSKALRILIIYEE